MAVDAKNRGGSFALTRICPASLSTMNRDQKSPTDFNVDGMLSALEKIRFED